MVISEVFSNLNNSLIYDQRKAILAGSAELWLCTQSSLLPPWTPRSEELIKVRTRGLLLRRGRTKLTFHTCTSRKAASLLRRSRTEK